MPAVNPPPHPHSHSLEIVRSHMPTVKTKLSAAYIAEICKAQGQETFAKRCGIPRSTVALHVTGERAIRDNHLASYLKGLDTHSRSELLAAWLRDVVSAETQASILQPQSGALKETVINWRPQLRPEHRALLEWWAESIPTDAELAQLLTSITNRLGYPKPLPKESAIHAAAAAQGKDRKIAS